MAIYSSFLKRFGLAKESERGTAESAPTEWLYVTPDSEISYGPAILENPIVKGYKGRSSGIKGLLSVNGTIKFPLQISAIQRFVHSMIPGTPTATEQTTCVITLNSNDHIDFTEDGGAEKTAHLTPGSYAYGTASSQAGTLCALIKSCLETANDSEATYTVTYAYATKKFTITKNSGVFILKWLTGTSNATGAHSTLGFTKADTSSQIAQTSDSTTGQWAFQHVFIPSDANEPQSYTLFVDRSISVHKYNGCNASQIKLSRSPDNFINTEIPIIGRSEASGSIGSPSVTESGVLSFQHDVIKIAGVSNTTAVKQWEVTLGNGLFPLKVTSAIQTITNTISLDNTTEGSFTIYFEDETERDKFVAGTTSSFECDITGSVIAGAVYYRLDVLCSEIQYTAFPYGVEDNLFAAKAVWKANYNSTDTGVYKLTINNIVSAF